MGRGNCCSIVCVGHIHVMMESALYTIREVEVKEAAVKGFREPVAFKVIGAEEAGVKKGTSEEEEQEGCYGGGTLCQAVFEEVGVVVGSVQQG